MWYDIAFYVINTVIVLWVIYEIHGLRKMHGRWIKFIETYVREEQYAYENKRRYYG